MPFSRLGPNNDLEINGSIYFLKAKNCYIYIDYYIVILLNLIFV